MEKSYDFSTSTRKIDEQISSDKTRHKGCARAQMHIRIEPTARTLRGARNFENPSKTRFVASRRALRCGNEGAF